MASSISALHSPLSCRLCRKSSLSGILSRSRPSLPLRSARIGGANGRLFSPMESRQMSLRAVAEEEASVGEDEGTEAAPEQSVSIPVSPSDVLTMIFKAEGTMDEAAIRNVKSNLEGVEGISNLKVQVLEGIASVELAKQTTVQATGVASSLVETIQGSGFKLQTLHLSFEDEEDGI